MDRDSLVVSAGFFMGTTYGADWSLCPGRINCQRGAQTSSLVPSVSRETSQSVSNPLKGGALTHLHFEESVARASSFRGGARNPRAHGIKCALQPSTLPATLNSAMLQRDQPRAVVPSRSP